MLLIKTRTEGVERRFSVKHGFRKPWCNLMLLLLGQRMADPVEYKQYYLYTNLDVSVNWLKPRWIYRNTALITSEKDARVYQPLRMLLEVVMVSVLVGVVLTLALQTLLMRWYLNRIPPQAPQDREQFPTISLPKVCTLLLLLSSNMVLFNIILYS